MPFLFGWTCIRSILGIAISIYEFFLFQKVLWIIALIYFLWIVIHIVKLLSILNRKKVIFLISTAVELIICIILGALSGSYASISTTVAFSFLIIIYTCSSKKADEYFNGAPLVPKEVPTKLADWQQNAHSAEASVEKEQVFSFENLEEFSVYAKSHPDRSIIFSSSDEYDAQYQKGFLLYEAGKYDDAIGELKKCFTINPVSIKARFEMCECHLQLKEYFPAQNDLLSLVDFIYNPEQAAKFYRRMGYIHTEKKQFDLARACYLYSLNYENHLSVNKELEYINQLSAEHSLPNPEKLLREGGIPLVHLDRDDLFVSAAEAVADTTEEESTSNHDKNAEKVDSNAYSQKEEVCIAKESSISVSSTNADIGDINFCYRCGRELLNDGDFCPKCGADAKSRFAHISSTLPIDTNTVSPAFNDSKPSEVINHSKRKHKTPISLVVAWSLSLVLAILLVAGTLYHIETVNNIRTENNNTISKLTKNYEESENKYKALEKKTSLSTKVLSAITSHSTTLTGYKDFYASRYIVVLKKNQTKTVLITLKHSYSTVYSTYGTWSKTWDGNTTSITFKGSNVPGIAVATLTNSVNSERFVILIVTTE